MLSVFDQGPYAPCPSRFNLAAHVLRAAATTPDKTALSIVGAGRSRDWTYRDLEQAVLGTARCFANMGLAPGARVLMRVGNSVDFPIAYLGAIAGGFVPVPTSTLLTAPELSMILDDIKPEIVVLDQDVVGPAYPKTVTIDDLRSFYAKAAGYRYEMGDPDRLGYVIYTSGTSGKPHAVGHAHRAIWARQMMIGQWSDLGERDRVLHAGAFNWTYTLGTGLMDPWTVGATALIPDFGVEIADLPALLAEHRATVFAAAPGVYRRLLNTKPTLALADLRHGLSAGEKLPEKLRKAWRKSTGTTIYEAFGMSECSTFISSGPAAAAQAGTIGRPQVGRKIAIIGPDGPVPVGSEGTIAVHNSDPGLMLGYLTAPEKTKARMRGNWFLTGDQGAMDQDGNISYLGRVDDMMNAGGYRVSPVEVEAALASVEGIDAVGVTDVEIKPDVRIIAAFYTGPKALDDSSLRRYAKAKLARYKQPRSYMHLPSLPTGINGKLLRRVLRDKFEAPDDQT